MHFNERSTIIATRQYTTLLKKGVPLGFNPLLISLFSILSLFAFPAHAALEGKLESAACDEVKGWAWDNVAPNTPIKVSIFDVNTKTNITTHLITLTAQQFRGNLLKTGQFNDNGKHGFSFMVPAMVLPINNPNARR